MKLIQTTLAALAVAFLVACDGGSSDPTENKLTTEELLTPFLKQYNQSFVSLGQATNYTLDTLYTNDLLSDLYYESGLDDILYEMSFYIESWDDSDIAQAADVLANMLNREDLGNNQYKLTFNTDTACADQDVSDECADILSAYSITLSYTSTTDGSITFYYDSSPVLTFDYGADDDHLDVTAHLEEAITMLENLGYDSDSLPDSLEGEIRYSVTTLDDDHIKVTLSTPEQVYFYNNGNQATLPESDNLLTLETNELTQQTKLNIQTDESIDIRFTYSQNTGGERYGYFHSGDMKLNLTIDNSDNTLALDDTTISDINTTLKDGSQRLFDFSVTSFSGKLSRLDDPFYGDIYQLEVNNSMSWTFSADNVSGAPIDNGISEHTFIEGAATADTTVQTLATDEFEDGKKNQVISGKLKIYKIVGDNITFNNETFTEGDLF